jgi:hypothetical protein
MIPSQENKDAMMTAEEEAYILSKAYVPEHVVSLMALVSKGDPFLIEDHLGFARNNWLILVGYPLDGDYSRERCGRILKQTVEKYRPEYLWFIGPEITPFLLENCGERETDQYYTLDLSRMKPKESLLRAARRASRDLTVERGHSMTGEHQALVSELLEREKLPERIRELYLAMPDYVSRSSTAWTLNARDETGTLCAFYVVDLAAADFSTYVLGSHSKRHYVPHASDLLFLEMIHLTREQGKNTIHLGLGVNEGIRRFKEKWGGQQFMTYEFCECRYGASKKFSFLDALMGMLNPPKAIAR